MQIWISLLKEEFFFNFKAFDPYRWWFAPIIQLFTYKGAKNETQNKKIIHCIFIHVREKVSNGSKGHGVLPDADKEPESTKDSMKIDIAMTYV